MDDGQERIEEAAETSDEEIKAEPIEAAEEESKSRRGVELAEEIERLRAEAATNLDGWQRTLAEFANYKRRSEAERGQLAFLTGVKIIEKLLPIIDDFDRAMANLPDDLKGNGWIEGVSLTRRKLVTLLQDEGVTPITLTPGDTFDPSLHEAVTHEESEQFKEGQIIAELQKGYRIGERMLRPALVRVAR